MLRRKWRRVPQSTMMISADGLVVSTTVYGIKLLSITRTGMVEDRARTLENIYQETWGKPLRRKPYPMQGRWLERTSHRRSVK